MDFLAALYAAIKAVPIIDKWASSFVDLYTRKSIEAITIDHIEKRDKVRVQLKHIRECNNHVEKAVLLAGLTDIERM